MGKYLLIALIAFCTGDTWMRTATACSEPPPGHVVSDQPLCRELCQYNSSSYMCDSWKQYYEAPPGIKDHEMVLICCLGMMLDWYPFLGYYNFYELYDPVTNTPTYELQELFNLFEGSKNGEKLAQCIRCKSIHLGPGTHKPYREDYKFYYWDVLNCMKSPGYPSCPYK